MLRTFALALVFAACGGGEKDADPFDTFQMCFDEHHTTESLSVHDAIVICCLDHPIAGVHPSCGDTANDCIAKLTGTDSVHNLSSTSATSAEIMTACTDYVTEKNK
jgi:hypothetical protein